MPVNRFKHPSYSLLTILSGSLLPVFFVLVSVTFHLMYVQIVISSIYVAEWPPFGKELTRLIVCSLSLMSICNFNYFPFWFLGQDLGSDCTSCWSLLTFFFSLVSQLTNVQSTKSEAAVTVRKKSVSCFTPTCVNTLKTC